MEQFRPKYKETLLLMGVILFMNTINLYIVYPDYVFTVAFLRAFINDTMVVSVSWLGMRRVIIFLDQVYPYQNSFLARVTVQIITTLLLSCSILLFLTWLSEHYVYHRLLRHELFTHHIWVYAFWVLIQNGIYIIIYQKQWLNYVKNQNKNNSTLIDKPANSIRIGVKLGNKTYYIEPHTIKFCTVTDDLSLISTIDGQSLVVEHSLQAMEKILPQDMFFRVNRQYILHRDLIKGIERIGNGKLKVNVNSMAELPSWLIVSRTKAPDLKQWLKHSVI